ncbi:MAG: hypothetical protein IJ783_05840 [Kiritimatiellae bacterium]|nr:hypothetical protein [Kiritimatiellia bacterium]
MANFYTHHGEAANCIWGAGTQFSGYGFLSSLGDSRDGSVAELKDENGQLVGLTVYNKKKTLSAEITMKKTQKQPEFGEIVSIDGTKYICRGSTKTAENENYARLSLSLESYQGVSL